MMSPEFFTNIVLEERRPSPLLSSPFSIAIIMVAMYASIVNQYKESRVRLPEINGDRLHEINVCEFVWQP